ncbi:DUF927 domain-containing protein [Mucilaginibacter sp.]|uniref:DUF927 domain-containing protein n=1 Tax=Mucilaginibacter sp. TaxID=1882438 RepID=UPI0035BBA897
MEKIDPIKIKASKVASKNLKRAIYVAEQAERDSIDITLGDGDWQKIANALATMGEQARDVFTRISCFTNPGGDQRSLEEINNFFDESLKTTKLKTPAKFFDVASNYGLEIKLPKSIKEAKEKITAGDIIGDEEHTEEFLDYGLWESGGVYWSLDLRYTRYQISNFTMKILWHVETSEDAAYRLIALKNIHGHTVSINMNTDDLVSVGAFKKIVARKGNFIFKGTDSDLVKLQDKLYRDEKTTVLVRQLGWNKRPQFYAFANGIYDLVSKSFKPVDELGIVEHDTKQKDGTSKLMTYFIPANSKIFEDKDDLFTNDKKFVYIDSKQPFKEVSSQFVLVYGKQGQLMLAYYMLALFSDIIFKELARRFPIFAVYGKRGTGKGTMIASAMRFFGEGQDQIMLGGASTTVGMMRKFSQYSNALVWVDEYKNNLPTKTIESIKNLYDRIGYERGKKDNTFETESTPIRSACVLSGQEMPTIEPALFTRVILASLTETKYTEAQRAEFKKLMAMEDAGLSSVTVHLLQHREWIEANFKVVYESQLKKLIKAVDNPEVEERMYSNYAALVTIMELLSTKEELPVEMVSFRELCKSNLLEQFFVLKGSDDASKFWDVVEMLFNQGMITEDKHFALKNGFLYIRVQDIFQYYSEALIKRKDPNGLDKQTLYKYLESDPKTFVQQKKKWFGGAQRWCHVFIYAELGIDLIRAEDEAALQRRYKEMKIKYVADDEQGEQQELDLNND